MSGRFPLAATELFNDPFCEDGLCSQDLGQEIAGDAWVARLRGSVVRPTDAAFLSYKSNCYSFDNGFIYLAFGYGLYAKQIYLAKFAPSGRTIWVKQMPFSYYEQGEGGALRMTADESRNLIYLGYPSRITFKTDVRPNTGTFVTTTGYGLACINAASGYVNWNNSWLHTSWINNCNSVTINGTTRLGPLRYDPYLDKISSASFQGFGTNEITLFPPVTGDPEAAIRYATSYTLPTSTYNPSQSVYVADRGYLGSQQYTVSKSVRSSCTLTPGFYPYPRGIGYGTTGRVYIAKFLKNGQLFIWFASNEIMIIGAERAIIDHVKFPATVDSPTQASFYSTIPRPFRVWPDSEGEPGDEDSAVSPSLDYEVVLAARERKIYMTFPSTCGTSCVSFSVTMNGSLVQSIDYMSLRLDSSSTSLNDGDWTGAAKYSSNNISQPRITGAIGGGSAAYWGYAYREVALSSVRRSNIDTNAAIATFGLGGGASSATVGPNASFRAVQTTVVPARTGLVESLSSYTTTVPSAGPTDLAYMTTETLGAFCFGQGSPYWLATQSDPVEPLDVTGTLIFDLYSYNIP